MHQKAFTLTLAGILTILVTFIFVAIIFFGRQPEQQNANQQEIAQPSDVENAQQSYYLSATIEELGISFDYPAAWGDLEIETHTVPDAEDGTSFRTETVVLTNGIPFLSAVTLGEAPGRQGWWGDIAADAASNTALQQWCDQLEQRNEYYHQPEETCKVYSNQQGLIFLNLHGDVAWYGTEVEEVDTYLTYHEGHAYYGIALSNQQLIYNGMSENEAAKALQEIVLSMEFIE